MARCPSHEDRRASLSIRELDDRRVLIHDFAGCAPADVLARVGLNLSDLFPDRPEHHRAPARDRKHFHAVREALLSLHQEALIVAIAAEQAADGVVLDQVDRDRLVLAVSRVRSVVEIVA